MIPVSAYGRMHRDGEARLVRGTAAKSAGRWPTGVAQARIDSLDHRSVEPENPHWRGRAPAQEDPDGWRGVLCTGGI